MARKLSDWEKKRQKAYGKNTMFHGQLTLPDEYHLFMWALDLTPREYLIILGLLGANKFEREEDHLPAYISQGELGARQGIKGGTVSQVLSKLEEATFKCPFCWNEKKKEGFTLKGYIRREPGKRTQENPTGNDLIWTDGVKEVVNHLAGHYNEYLNEYGWAEGKEKFKQDRNNILEGRVPQHLKQAGKHAWLHTERAKVWLHNQEVEPEF